MKKSTLFVKKIQKNLPLTPTRVNLNGYFRHNLAKCGGGRRDSGIIEVFGTAP